MVPGLWPDITVVSIRMLKQLASEQNKETSLQQTDAVQTRTAALSLPGDYTTLYSF